MKPMQTITLFDCLNICCVDGQSITNHDTQQDENNKDIYVRFTCKMKHRKLSASSAQAWIAACSTTLLVFGRSASLESTIVVCPLIS
jgi:hypothetical protein